MCTCDTGVLSLDVVPVAMHEGIPTTSAPRTCMDGAALPRPPCPPLIPAGTALRVLCPCERGCWEGPSPGRELDRSSRMQEMVSTTSSSPGAGPGVPPGAVPEMGCRGWEAAPQSPALDQHLRGRLSSNTLSGDVMGSLGGTHERLIRSPGAQDAPDHL